jgi:nucleoside-diphosphate-sugar epimerase
MGLHLVTGGAGYFGSILVRRLHRDGEKARVFDLNPLSAPPAGTDVRIGDIRDPRALESACDGIDCVYHCVAQVPLAKDRHLFWSVNVEGTESLLKAAWLKGVRKIVLLSSSAVFGIPSKNPIDDAVLPHPREAYGKAKYRAEQIAQQWTQQGLDVTIIRPRTILGHGRLGIFSVLFDWISKDVSIPVLGDGNNRFQLVHAEDLADACIRAAAKRGSATYNIGAAEFGTMRQLLDDLIKHAGSRSRVVSFPMWLTVPCMNAASALGLSPLGPYHALMYGREIYFDLSKPKRELGWMPRYGNSEMIAESYNWFLANTGALTGNQGSFHQKRVREGILCLLRFLLSNRREQE